MTRSEACSRPTIELKAGELESLVDQAEEALIAASRGLYQRGGAIVFVGNARVITPADGEVSIRRIFECGDHALLEHLNAAAAFKRFDKRSEEWVGVDAPTKIAHTLKDRKGSLRFPILSGVIDAPTLRADGSVLDRIGYDARTGLILEPGSTRFGPIPAEPTVDQAHSAARRLAEMVDTFPFVSDADRSVALSAMITACVRRALRTAPMHGFTAPAAGSGKSMLVDICSILATGREAPVIAQGATEEEMDKRLGAVLLLSGDAVLSIDNCELPLGGEFLCQMLTQTLVRPRILGKSEAPELPPNLFMAATGNNLRLVGDMTRRALLCRLDPQVERPELRTFKTKPLATAKKQRGALVVAALTVLRAYIAAGRPKQVAELGSFEEWSNLVRSALVWLGYADPVETMEQARDSDPRLDELNAVVAQWSNVLGTDRVTVRKVIERATERKPTVFEHADFAHPDFREALLVVAGRGGAINTRALGNWLSSKSKRIAGGFCFEQVGTSGGTAVWQLREQGG